MVQTIIFKLFDKKIDYKYIFSKQHFLQSFTDFIIYFFLVLFQSELLGQPMKIILKTDAITTSPFTRLESSFHTRFFFYKNILNRAWLHVLNNYVF